MYRTGDLGRQVDDGQIECLGRNDDQVKLRGFRIELGEIEETLGQHHAIARAAVIAREDRPGDRRLVGYLVLRKDRTVTDAALRAHVSRFLPEYMIPAAFVRLDALPLTPSGKVNRRDLPAPAMARGEQQILVPPHTPIEAMLVDVWRQAFGLHHVSVDDNFFALGGHSLLASNVLARLRRDHGIEILFRTIFEAPTIRQLAERIDAEPRNGDRADRAIPRRADKALSPLSVAQERMWLLEMMDPHQRVVHNLPAGWRLSGDLDEGVLETSLNAIVARHETLRTRIVVRDSMAYQEVVPRAPLALGRLDLRDRPEVEREAEMLAFCDRESRTPHDLAAPPLFRATLIRLDERQHVLFIVPHNVIWDGWSFDIFLRELSELYAAFLDGRPSTLEDLAISYRDFAGWQRAWLASDRSARPRTWWRTYLEGSLPVLDIPSDRHRPVEPTLVATQIEAHLSREKASALTAISGTAGGTLFTILFAAFCLLVHRLSGSDEVLVGTLVHGRTRPETEELIGLFTNILVLRTRIEREETFPSFLSRVREMTLDAFGHQELPLEALDIRAPILRAFFTMEDGRQQTQRIGGLAVGRVSTPPSALAADLRLSATETTEGVSLAWTSSSELFDTVTAERFLKRFQGLLDQVVQDPRRRISEINLIPDDERFVLDAFGNSGSSSEPVEKRVLSLFEEQARRRPHAAAILCGPDRIEYGQLDRRAAAVARSLRAGGIRDGSRVGVFLPRSADLVTALLAVMKAGATWVPVDPDDPPARRAAILQDSGVELVLTDETLRPRLPAGSTPLVCVDELAKADVEPADPTALTGSSGTPIDATACLLYSSDTHPLRAAAVSHRTLAALVAAVVQHLAITEDEVASAISPPSLDASVVELLAPLATGARLLLTEGDVAVDTAHFAEMAARSTFVIAPTALWEDLLMASTTLWPKLKTICIGELPAPEIAAALTTRTAGAWAAHGFMEAGIWATLNRLSDSQPATVVGHPLSHLRVRVADPACDHVPLGLTGEVCVSPTGNVASDWYRTGQRARWRNDGALELVAARTRHVHVGGFRTDLDDVSRVLLRELAVQDALVVRQARATERLVAYIVPRPGLIGTATEWRRELRRVLPERAIPRSFVEIDAIPRTAEGRLDLVRTDTDTAEDDYIPPRTPTEILLADVWKDALDLPRIGLHDNFFDLGGYSLLCFQVLARIERETHHCVSPRLLLLDSLQQVAAQLDATAAPGDHPLSERSGRKRFLDRFRGAPSAAAD
jgi:non-ribosomal peptide synthetase component F